MTEMRDLLTWTPALSSAASSKVYVRSCDENKTRKLLAHHRPRRAPSTTTTIMTNIFTPTTTITKHLRLHIIARASTTDLNMIPIGGIGQPPIPIRNTRLSPAEDSTLATLPRKARLGRHLRSGFTLMPGI